MVPNRPCLYPEVSKRETPMLFASFALLAEKKRCGSNFPVTLLQRPFLLLWLAMATDNAL